MTDWFTRAKAYAKRQNEQHIQEPMSSANLISNLGRDYDDAHKDEDGYTSLSRRWDDIYNRATKLTFEEMRQGATDDWDALADELNQYSKYYNPTAVSYVQSEISRRKALSDTIANTAKDKERLMAEFDYNAVWEDNFYTLLRSGKFDAAETALANLSAKTGNIANPETWASFISSPEKFTKEYQKTVEYGEALQNAREYAEYNPLVDKYEGMSKEELQSALEGLQAAYHNAKIDTPSGADPLGLSQQRADDIAKEMGYLNYLINKDSPEWQAKVAAAEEAKAKQERIDNASGWERFGAWLADTANNALYAPNNMVEGIADFANNGYVALGDAINVIRREILDTVETRADLRPYAKRLKQDIEKWNEDRKGYIDTIQYDWAMDLSNLNEDHYVYDDLSWMSDYPELQRQFNGVIQGVAGMAPAILAAPVTGGTSLSWIPRAYMTLAAAGGATNEALDAGNSPLDAAAHGAAIGALEYGSEMIGGSLFGGATELMATPLGRWIVKHGADKFFGKGVGKAAYTFASEGFEEIIMDIATPLAQSAFDIGNSQDTYFGSNAWEDGWKDVISGIRETFVVGGTVGAIVEGFHSGASAIANKDKGGFKYNKIADEMTIIENALKAQETVKQSKNANEEIIDAFSEKATQRVATAVKSISKTMQQLSAEERAAIFADAPVLEMFLNEDGTLSAETDLDNIYLTQDDIENYLKAGSRNNINRQHRYESGQNIIISSETELVSFVEKSIKGNHNEMVAYGKVSERLANDVKAKSNSTIDISGAYLELLSDDIQHSYNEHVHAKEPGDLDMSQGDLISALKNVNKGEVINARKYKDGGQRVMLAVPVSDGMMMLVELASKSAGTVRLKTGWKISNEKFQQKYRSSTSTTGRRISTNAVHDNTASNSSISQNGENVNRKVSTYFERSAKLADMGENGVQIMHEVYDGSADPVKFFEAYNRVYAAGKKGGQASGRDTSFLGEYASKMAYNAGRMDAMKKSSAKVLQNDGGSDTINTVNKEAQNGQQQNSVHLRDGGERNDGKNSGGQVSAVEGNAGQNKGRREGRTGPRDSEASTLSYDREVSAKELVKGGLESSKVWLPTEGSETESMKEARKIAESRGLKIVFFGGGNLKVLKGSKIISARAYIQGDTVYVRVDHAGFSAYQLMLHEAAHDMIDKGEINVADVKKLIGERFTPEEIDAIKNAYAIAYEGAGMTADEIWVEIICDSVAEMNSFEGTEFTSAAEMAADFLPDLKEAVLESKKESRGPPKSAEGRASREPVRYIPYGKVGADNINHINNELRTLYKGVSDGIADGIAISNGNKVFIIDSGKENGNISFGIRKIITISNDSLRSEYVRRTNNDAVSKGYISDGLSSKIEGGYDSNRRSNRRQESGAELSADQGKSADNQKGISEENADNRGLNGHASIDLAPMDADYMSAVESGDMETAQRMVDEAAKGHASIDFEYTDDAHNDYGWVRANNIISAGYWRNFTENFAQAVTGHSVFPKNKNGEFMIDVYDAYDFSGITDVIVFARGIIESPNVSKIIKLNSSDAVVIEDTRRDIYALERRGIQCKAGHLLNIYTRTDFVLFGAQRADSESYARNNNELRIRRSRSEIKANPIIEFHVNEENGTVTTVYANGEVVTKKLGDGHASLDLNEMARDVDAEALDKQAKRYQGSRASSFKSDPDVQHAHNSGSSWDAERIKDGKVKEAKPVSEIIERIRHDFGINITKGHVHGKNVLGQYNKRDHGIRTKIANDLPTVAHELGHALDQRYGLTDKIKLSKEMRTELINALGDLKDSYKQNLWVSEGLAEYMRRFLQNRDDAARSYPEFTKYFLNSLSKPDRVLIDTFADEINAYYALDADTATSSIRFREEGTPDARTPLEKAREMGDDIYQAWVDANHGIRLFDEATGADTYKLATNAAYSDAIAGQIIVGDLTDANGQYVAPGLKAALEGVNIGDKKTYREFGEYLVLKHGPERLNEGLMVFADPRKNTASFMNKRREELEAAHPEFKEAADRLYKFQKQFLQTWLVDTGLISQEVADEWFKRWDFYVPFNRAVGKAGRAGAKKGYANQNSTIKKAIGSGLDIVHPVDNIINNIVKMVNAGVRNNVMLAITNKAIEIGADATFLEKVPTPMKKKTADLTGVKAKLHDAFGAAGIDELLAEIEADEESSKKILQKPSNGDIIGTDTDSLRRVEDGTERTDEFRELQKRSREMSDREIQEYHSGKELSQEVRRRLSRTFSLELNSAGGKRIYSKRTLLNPKTNRSVFLLEIDGQLFHDIFEISRNYLENGELVDLHNEYDNATCYLTEDGLSGFAIEGNGNLVSVFNLSNERGFLRTIAPVIKENATMLDCYASEKQDLQQMYSLIFGFKTASIMDYNMEYDHDNIAENHGMPKVAFMVNTEVDVETKEFGKDEYGEAVVYQKSFVGDNVYNKRSGHGTVGNAKTKSEAWSQIDDIIESAIDDVLIQYGQGKAHGDVVTVMRNGKQEFWKINDALLLESLTSMSQKKMSGILEAYAVVSRFMTSNITGNNIVWSIFSNFPRDMMTFFTYSKQKNPLKAFPAMGEAYLNKVSDGKVDTKHLPYIKEYYALGGGQTSAYTADVDLAKRARKKLKHTTKWQSATYYFNPLNTLSFISETVESGPRIATYIMMREQGMSPQDAFYESQDITVNFKRGGRLAREFNKAVPFFNASVQGLDKFKRWITCADVPRTQRSKAIVGRVITYVAVSAAIGALIYALNNADDDDEENYRLLSNYTKNTYWNIPLGDGKYFAIPKPREIAVLSTFVETSCEYFGGNDYAYDEFGDYVADNFLPPFVSDFVTDGFDGALGSLGMIGVTSDLKANKDFLGRPIESASLQAYESRDRYTRRTSYIAYWLGQAAAELGLDWSPVQIDYFFSQTLGGYWKVQKALFPVGRENVDWTLGVQNTYVKDNQYSNDIINWMYTQADESAMAHKSHPNDMDIAIDAKLDSNMKSFYSKYYALTKNKKETAESRIVKRAILDMISGYRTVRDSDKHSAAEEAVYDVVRSSKDTGLLPAVMQSTVKDGEGKEITLTDVEYYEYQTRYNALYWEFIESNLGGAKTDEEKIAIIKQAQSIAKSRATEEILKTAGAVSSGEFDKYPGIDDDDLVTFKTQVSVETARDGGMTQSELIEILEKMVADGLSMQDAYTLFKSRYPDSDKNNPWRSYAP